MNGTQSNRVRLHRRTMVLDNGHCTNPLRGNLVVTTGRLTPVPIPVSQLVAVLVREISGIVAGHEQHNTG
jgi:hypothetical protein